MEKSKYWYIYSLETVGNDVVFEKSLTEEEARKDFLEGRYEDIMDQDFQGTEKILSMTRIPE